MTSFDSVISTWTTLTNAIIGKLESEPELKETKVVDPISVCQPTPPEDELYFYKLVNWSYIALIESSPVVLKQLSNHFRSNDNENYTQFNQTKALIVALRTVHNHNSKLESTSDQRKISLIQSWKISHQKDSTSWESLCVALCAELTKIFTALIKAWDLLIESEIDSIGFISALKCSILSELPAHTFDDFLEQVANDLNLIEFNLVEYRKRRIEDWRKCAVLFATKEAMERGMQRVINSELTSLFGKSQHS